jgi:phage recombination protein Bet
MTVEKKHDLVVFSDDKIKLIKDTVCKDASDNELQLFLHVCQQVKLDPFMKQIYSIPRKNKNKDGSYTTVRTIQTSIDGYRLIAERTGKYAPGKEPSFVYDSHGRIVSATSYVKKMTPDGTWHEVSATAFMAEYHAGTSFWDKMPHGQLAKCAETLALRKAFPAEFSAIRSDEEMEQAGGMEIIQSSIIQEAIPHSQEVKRIGLSEQGVEEEMKKFFAMFPGEDHAMMESYLARYAKHYEKSMWEALLDYKDNKEKFSSDFNCWRKKHNKAA